MEAGRFIIACDAGTFSKERRSHWSSRMRVDEPPVIAVYLDSPEDRDHYSREIMIPSVPLQETNTQVFIHKTKQTIVESLQQFQVFHVLLTGGIDHTPLGAPVRPTRSQGGFSVWSGVQTSRFV